jgi:hypothetical protein
MIWAQRLKRVFEIDVAQGTHSYYCMGSATAAGDVTVYPGQPVAPDDQKNTLGAIKIIAG